MAGKTTKTGTKKKIVRSDLPFGSEFSPSQIDLRGVLNLIVENHGNWRALEAAILANYFSKHAKNATGANVAYNKNKLANNCKLGLIAYGIINRDGTFTDFGLTLHALVDDESKLYEALARHILLNLRGMALLQCIKEMTAAGEDVSLNTLRDGLAARGVHYPSGGKHPSIMRLWLEKAGVFIGRRWQIDELRLRRVLGTDPAEFGILARFTPEQRAFLLALANTGVTGPQPANEIVKLATATYGVRFPEKSLPKVVLNVLQKAGYISATKTTAGRGAKPFSVTPTAKLNADVIRPLLDQVKTQVDPKLLDLLAKPLTDILNGLDSTDRYAAGLALEALAFKLMRLFDMTYVATRLRAQATGGAEVDLVFDSARLVFHRWQIQCKNTDRVALDDVAKEVGLTHFIKSNAIVVVSTGDIGAEARKYANKVMTDSNLCVVLLDRADLENIRTNPSFVVDAFNREARHAMTLKKLEF
ncbi:MAG TPA: restriction endonuclease [Burkholderiales bacterium]|nr:restriction endonuclease [Burkholderiales bacterium]